MLVVKHPVHKPYVLSKSVHEGRKGVVKFMKKSAHVVFGCPHKADKKKTGPMSKYLLPCGQNEN